MCPLGISGTIHLQSSPARYALKHAVLGGYKPAERGGFLRTSRLSFRRGGRSSGRTRIADNRSCDVEAVVAEFRSCPQQGQVTASCRTETIISMLRNRRTSSPSSVLVVQKEQLNY